MVCKDCKNFCKYTDDKTVGLCAYITVLLEKGKTDKSALKYENDNCPFNFNFKENKPKGLAKMIRRKFK